MYSTVYFLIIGSTFFTPVFAMSSDEMYSTEESGSGHELNQIFDMRNHELDDITTLFSASYDPQHVADWLASNPYYFSYGHHQKGLLHTLIDLAQTDDEVALCGKMKELIKAGAPINEVIQIDGKQGKEGQTPLDYVSCLIRQYELENFHNQAGLHAQKKDSFVSEGGFDIDAHNKDVIDKLWVMHQALHSCGGRTIKELRLKRERYEAELCFML